MTNPQLMQERARFFTLGSLVPAAVATLGAVLLGGCSSTPQTAVLTGDGGGADTAASRASHVVMDGYLMAGPWSGGGFTATDPGAATITPSCTADSLHASLHGQRVLHAGDGHRPP